MAVITYQTPGVYIEEVPSGARPIQAVGTRTAGFVGSAPNPKCYLNQPVAINNWAEFVSRFMSAEPELMAVAAAAREALEAAVQERRLAQAVVQAQAGQGDLAQAQYQAVLDKAQAARAGYTAACGRYTEASNTLQVAQGKYQAYVAALPGAAPAGPAAPPAAAPPAETPAEPGPDTQAVAVSPQGELAVAVSQVTQAQTAVADATKALNRPRTFQSTDLSNAVYGFFLNGGSRCWVVNVGPQGAPGNEPPISAGGGATHLGLDLLEKVDEIAIVAAPGYTDLASYEAIRTHCDKLKDRVGILDGPEELDDNALSQLSGEEATKAKWEMPQPSEHGQLTLYVPWIEISDPDNTRSDGGGPKRLRVPPSGHVAGVWARSDATRGVHKAPANEPVGGALGLQRQITHEEQGLLNTHGVNVIRQFRDEGILVWGARTLTLDPTFRYLNVRRLFNMIEESILESTRWIVFEPNDRPLWESIRRDVTAFLLGFWRDGALVGRTPEEAFFVKCDDETNPIDSIREGKVVIQIGLAPVFPAEFVIFQISQYQAGSQVEVQPA